MGPSVAPGLAPPWWLEEALAAEPAAPDAPALEGNAETDVAIVGGGYTGLWTALALRERDPSLRVAVLEAEICGWGPSGRNGGFLHGFWTQLAVSATTISSTPSARAATATRSSVASCAGAADTLR